MSQREKTWGELVGELVGVVIVVGIMAMFCGVDDHDLHEILEAQGYSDIIRRPGYAHGHCSEDDVYASLFEATTLAGARVEGVVCCGGYKACTTRLDRVLRPAPHERPKPEPVPPPVVPPPALPTPQVEAPASDPAVVELEPEPVKATPRRRHREGR